MASTIPGILGRSMSLTSLGKASHGGSWAGAGAGTAGSRAAETFMNNPKSCYGGIVL
jgi:hypothetical protein